MLMINFVVKNLVNDNKTTGVSAVFLTIDRQDKGVATGTGLASSRAETVLH